MFHNRWRFSFRGAFSVLTLFALACCAASSDQGSLGQEDVATYACALLGDIDESAVDWDPTPGGSEIDDEFTSAISAVDLLGGASGIPLEDYADLYDPTLAQALHQLDLEVVDAQLGSLQDACETEDLSTPEADVSHDGRLSFACTLIADVNDADSTPDDRFRAMADESPSDEGFTLTKIFGAVSLTGGTMGAQLPDQEEISKASSDTLKSITRLDSEAMDEAIRDFNTACNEL